MRLKYKQTISVLKIILHIFYRDFEAVVAGTVVWKSKMNLLSFCCKLVHWLLLIHCSRSVDTGDLMWFKWWSDSVVKFGMSITTMSLTVKVSTVHDKLNWAVYYTDYELYPQYSCISGTDLIHSLNEF